MAQPTVVVDVALLGKMAGYIEMLVKDPYSTVFASLSDIYRTFSLHEEAVAVAQKGTELLPSYAPGFVSLGRALAETGEPAAASEAYRRALVLEPSNLAALTGLASCCLACGQGDESLSLLKQAQSIDPDDEVVIQLFPVVKKLAAVTSASFPVPRAQPADTPLRDVSPSISKEHPKPVAIVTPPLPPIATATLADIYLKQGFFERALKVFADLLAEDPDNVEIRRRYDELRQQLSAPSKMESTESVTTLPGDVEPPELTRLLPDGDGKGTLVALYGRWLDAITRRRANVQ